MDDNVEPQYAWAFCGNLKMLQKWVKGHANLVNNLSKDRGCSLLYSASRNGHLDVVKLLITEAESTDVNLQNSNENASTALHGACFGGHPEIVSFLLEHGAKKKLQNGFGETPEDNAGEPAEDAVPAKAAECVKLLKNFVAPKQQQPPPAVETAGTEMLVEGKKKSEKKKPNATEVPKVEEHKQEEKEEKVAKKKDDEKNIVVEEKKKPAPICEEPYTSKFLTQLTLPQLRKICEQWTLAGQGVKAKLIERILQHQSAAAMKGTKLVPPIPAIAGKKPGDNDDDNVGGEVPPAAKKKKLEEQEKTEKKQMEEKGASKNATLEEEVEVEEKVEKKAEGGKKQKEKGEEKEEKDSASLDPAWLKLLSSATATQTSIMKDTEEFWALEEKVMAWNQGRNEDYVQNRIKKKKKPLTFILKAAWKVENKVLEEAFKKKRQEISKQYGDESVARVRVAFHGTKAANIDSILKTSLLRFKHPMNPCQSQADDGYFGTNRKGVYVSRYFDYTLKYSNSLNPLDESESVKIIMFKCLPGKNFHVEKLNIGMEPKEGYNSHSSPSHLEWYLFDEAQLCPEYVLEIQAKLDTRTAADDE